MSKHIWSPSKEFSSNSNMEAYKKWVNKNFNLSLNTYADTWNWSIENNDSFWKSILNYFNINYDGDFQKVWEKNDKYLSGDWFKGIKLNYAEHIFKNKKEGNALIFKNEFQDLKNITWDELYSKTASLVEYFKSIKLTENDCVCCFSPNTPEALIGFLATNSIGATWSSCSPDFGTNSVIDRFEQIKPKVLIACNGYQYNGKQFSKLEDINDLRTKIKSITNTIVIDYISLDIQLENTTSWKTAVSFPSNKIKFNRVNFNHPIWVLYSSGTTGKPKAITHGYGGILLEHYKALVLHQNIKPKEKFFWFSTTGWMMWNYANSALLAGGELVIYDGSPAFPQLNSLWKLVEDVGINHFGAGASYFISCMKEKIDFKQLNLSSIKSFGSTGSPLSEEAFEWLNQVQKEAWIISLSGGTDVCSGFVGGNPFAPVLTGEIQCRMLGVNLRALDENGVSVENELGEMVIENLMPSMPIYFWNDSKNQKYFESYFNDYPGKWRHGDFIKISDKGSIIIYGRSDSTLNRGGVRIGTSEIYNALQNIGEIKDSLVVCLDLEGGSQFMPLFIQLKETVLTDELEKRIKTTLRTTYSPRHVPDKIIVVKEIPYTLSGKKMETPVKKLLMGKDISKSISKDAMRNPWSIELLKKAFENSK